MVNIGSMMTTSCKSQKDTQQKKKKGLSREKRNGKTKGEKRKPISRVHTVNLQLPKPELEKKKGWKF